MSHAVRIVIVVLMALFGVACVGVTIATKDAGAEFGWNVGTDGTTIINVEPNGPAARAGIRAGDRILYSKLPLLGRINTIESEGVYVGATLTFPVEHRGTTRTVTVASRPFPGVLGYAYLAYGLGAIAIGCVGLALVVLRPSRMTWACALIAPALLISESIYQWAQRASVEKGFAFQCGISVIYALQTFGLISFASRFPNDKPKGIARVLDRLAVPFAAVALAIYLYVDYAIFFSPVPPSPWALAAQDYASPRSWQSPF